MFAEPWIVRAKLIPGRRVIGYDTPHAARSDTDISTNVASAPASIVTISAFRRADAMAWKLPTKHFWRQTHSITVHATDARAAS